MTYEITTMTAADMDGKGYVHWKAWQETYPGLMPQAVLDRMTLEKCIQIAHQWPDGLIVAKQGEHVIGFAGYGKCREDALPDTGEVFALYVLKDFHGQKVGYALMNEAIRRLNAYPQIALWVLKGNERAIRFYRRYGFAFDGAETTSAAGTELRMIYHR